MNYIIVLTGRVGAVNVEGLRMAYQNYQYELVVV